MNGREAGTKRDAELLCGKQSFCLDFFCYFSSSRKKSKAISLKYSLTFMEVEKLGNFLFFFFTFLLEPKKRQKSCGLLSETVAGKSQSRYRDDPYTHRQTRARRIFGPSHPIINFSNSETTT